MLLEQIYQVASTGECTLLEYLPRCQYESDGAGWSARSLEDAGAIPTGYNQFAPRWTRFLF